MTPVIALLHRGSPGTDESPAATIAALGKRLGLTIVPLHPDTTDPELAGWMHVTVPQGQSADEVLGTLLADAAVAAAYQKPPDAAP